MKVPLTSTMECGIPLTSDELLLLHVGVSSLQDDPSRSSTNSPTRGVDIGDRDEWAMRTSDVEDEHGKPKLLGSIQLEKAARSLISLTTNGNMVDSSHKTESELSMKLNGVRRSTRVNGRLNIESIGDGDRRSLRPLSGPTTADKAKQILGPSVDASPSASLHYFNTHSNYVGSAVLNANNNTFFSSDMLLSPSGSSSSTSVGISPFSSNLKRPYTPPDTVSSNYPLKNAESSKRRRAVNITSQPTVDSYSTAISEPQPGHFNGTLVHKPALLTISQKKANHIQSEQKRRANIRRGYEALCSTVPALREAIRLEDEALQATELAAADSRNGFTNGKRKRRKLKEETERNNDGRAGPRSENVVLQKTIDYITDLLYSRSELLSRLHRARSLLPNGHPALTVIPPIIGDGLQLWEREWTGGGSGMQEGDEDGYSDEEER